MPDPGKPRRVVPTRYPGEALERGRSRHWAAAYADVPCPRDMSGILRWIIARKAYAENLSKREVQRQAGIVENALLRILCGEVVTSKVFDRVVKWADAKITATVPTPPIPPDADYLKRLVNDPRAAEMLRKP